VRDKQLILLPTAGRLLALSVDELIEAMGHERHLDLQRAVDQSNAAV
jgi:hypothetical protein